jgi:hypothetical protein
MQSEIDRLTSHPSIEFITYCCDNLYSVYDKNDESSMRVLIGILALRFSERDTNKKPEMRLKFGGSAQKTSLHEQTSNSKVVSLDGGSRVHTQKDAYETRPKLLSGAKVQKQKDFSQSSPSKAKKLDSALHVQKDISQSKPKISSLRINDLKDKRKPNPGNPNPTPSKGFPFFFAEKKNEFPHLEGKELSMAVNHLWQKLPSNDRTMYFALADIAAKAFDEEIPDPGAEDIIQDPDTKKSPVRKSKLRSLENEDSENENESNEDDEDDSEDVQENEN